MFSEFFSRHWKYYVMYFKYMFRPLKTWFRRKEKEKSSIEPHSHENFIGSFNDEELNWLSAQLICCRKDEIPDRMEELLSYLRNISTEEDYQWYANELEKEYKNNN